MRRRTINFSLAAAALAAGAAFALPAATASAAPTPHVKTYAVALTCLGTPCGTNGVHTTHGEYVVSADNLPANTKVVTTVVKPDGTPYPYNQYTNKGVYLGQHGSIGKTDSHGRLSNVNSHGVVTGWQWSANNGPSVLADPAGTYGVKLTFQAGGHTYNVTTFLVETKL